MSQLKKSIWVTYWIYSSKHLKYFYYTKVIKTDAECSIIIEFLKIVYLGIRIVLITTAFATIMKT